MSKFDPYKEFENGRCTNRDEYGNADINGVDMTFMLGLNYEEMNTMQQALNRLADFEDGLSARPTGEWVPHILAKGQKSIDNDVCSECGERYADAWEFNFCPNCGAKMTKGGDE